MPPTKPATNRPLTVGTAELDPPAALPAADAPVGDEAEADRESGTVPTGAVLLGPDAATDSPMACGDQERG